MIAPAAVIVLAAGEGTRMKSSTPKVLHEVCGRTMLGHVLAAARELRPARLAVVVGDTSGPVASYLAEYASDALPVIQRHRGGTGHAVRVAVEALGRIGGTVVVTYGDTPLLRGATLGGLVAAHESAGAAVTALVARAADPAGYGRIIRDADGGFAGIVEQADATPEQARIDEINTGMYAFDGRLLADAVTRLTTANAKGEEYLTDVLSILRADGFPVGTVWCEDFDEILGVNDQAQLARARRVLNDRLLGSWMGTGVTIVDPASTWVDVGVVLEPGALIGPATQLEGGTTIGAGARIGPGCLVRDSVISARATVIQSVCEWAEVGPGAVVGPFAHLTAGMKIEGPADPDAGGLTAADASTSAVSPAAPGPAVPRHAGPGSAGPGSPVRQGEGEQGS
jgi:bifunctional UDP-N-acetylglucosamine pyrophosphorylase/glucosamine-1-phosphate N-acetyltransferase